MVSSRIAFTKSAHVLTSASLAAKRRKSAFSTSSLSSFSSELSVVFSSVSESFVASFASSEVAVDSFVSSTLLVSVSAGFAISLSFMLSSILWFGFSDELVEFVISSAPAEKIFRFGSKIISNKKKIILRWFISFSPPSQSKSYHI